MLTDVDSPPYACARGAHPGHSDLTPYRGPPFARADNEGNRDTRTGRFAFGNKAWEARATSAGPAPRFADGESLWKACVEYFEWVEDNPLVEMRLVTWKGRTTQVPLHRVRAMTKGDLCRSLGIACTTWRSWKRDRSDLSETIERVESVIWSWQFDHAAAGLLDAAMVIRQLFSNKGGVRAR
jgi:DNA-packaging protein gp3